jgi:fructose-specific component phosphotransferase system IIB-like protein
MPVQTGYGNTELDFICARKIRISDQRAWFHTWEIFLIEAKAHGQNPTPRQAAIIEAHRAAGRKVFVIDDEHASLVPKHDSLEELNKWLDSL